MGIIIYQLVYRLMMASTVAYPVPDRKKNLAFGELAFTRFTPIDFLEKDPIKAIPWKVYCQGAIKFKFYQTRAKHGVLFIK